MSAQTLERRYRRLLIGYPKEYREQRGDEIVATLLDCAPPGLTRPRLGESADLLAAGLRRRLGVTALPGLNEGVALATPMALALLAGVSGFLLLRVEPLRPTTGVVAYVIWLLAVAAWAFLGPRAGRLLLTVGIGMTLAQPLIAAALGAHRPPIWVLMTLTFLGSLARSGLRSASDLEKRVAVLSGALAAAIAADQLLRLWPRSGAYYQPTISVLGIVVAVAVAAMAFIALSRLALGARGRFDSARSWMWAVLLIGLPGAWLGPLDVSGARLTALACDCLAPVPRFGRLAEVLVGTCLVIGAMAWLGRPSAPRRHDLGRVGAIALGYTIGLVAYAAALHAVSERVVLTALICSAVGAVALPGRKRLLAGLVALTLTLLAGLAVGVYANDWLLRDWVQPRTANLVTMTAIVPLAWALYDSVGALRECSERRGSAALVAALSAGWLGYLLLPDLPAWGPVLLVLALVPAARMAVSLRQ